MVSFDTLQVPQSDHRRSLRVNEALPILWRVKDAEISGAGRIHNISDSGMMLEAETAFSLNDNTVFNFETSNGRTDYLPMAGRLVWSRKANPDARRCQLGIEFIDPSQETLTQLREKIKAKVRRTRKMEKTRNIAGFFLIGVLVLLTAFSVTQQVAIEKDYEQSTQLLLTTSNHQANLYVEVSNNLKETKSILAQTEAMLAQAKEENLTLQSELEGARKDISVLHDELAAAQTNIQMLKNENENLSRQVADLKERLHPFEGEVASIQDGRASMNLVRKRLRDIKVGIGGLKQRARLAMIAAQKENDRILLEKGNQGYFIRNAKPVTSSSATIKPGKKVKIDVTIFGQP